MYVSEPGLTYNNLIKVFMQNVEKVLRNYFSVVLLLLFPGLSTTEDDFKRFENVVVILSKGKSSGVKFSFTL